VRVDPNVANRVAPAIAADAGLTINRVFDASRRLVWTEPERFADWFGGAEAEVPASSVSIDLRPGGAWRATTLSYGADRRDICWQGVYVVIVEPALLVFTIRGYDGEQVAEEVTVVLTDLGDNRTEMLFRQRGARTASEWDRARASWSSEFDRIAVRLLEAKLGNAS
jgi:uncharacterized protein YndB with AHSA1/START domain